MGSIQFVNYLGAEVSLCAQTQAPKRKTNGGGLIFKGFRVVGIPPGALEAAKEQHDKKQKISGCVGFTQFDEEVFLSHAKKRTVNARPYSIPEAAEVCAEITKKAGWLKVSVES